MTDFVSDLLSYIDVSPTPWHAVDETEKRLEAAGFKSLDEREEWALNPGDKIFVTRSGSSICALELGTAPAAEAGFRLIGAHTDSPNLRIKPKSDMTASGARQLAVEPYGGVLLHTWLDRDLSIGGRVAVQGDDGIESRRFRGANAFCRIPSLAIHLSRKVNDEGLILNKQKHMAPIFGLEKSTEKGLAALLAGELAVAEDAILGWDLCLFDSLASATGGASNELVFAPRLDNLASCHAGLSALMAVVGSGRTSEATRGIVLYDHEEVGSRSAQGADSPFLSDVLERVSRASTVSADARQRALSRSFLISADMAHAVHPNYADKHEPAHMPQLGAGPVIKTNSNQRYATDAETAARFRAWCKQADFVPQEFVTRSDLACGSTIGPITAGRLGVKTIDVGNPMLSMHSCREMCSALDVAPMIDVMRVFFERAD